jgi:hypothetical protein
VVTSNESSDQSKPEFPRLVYHYTRATGLKGIVKHRNLWASHLRYLNDSQEHLVVYQKAVQYLDRITVVRNLANSHRTLTGAIRETLETSSLGTPKPHPSDRFVVSFSELGDDLSQWRAYGRLGQAYALGFSGEMLAEAALAAGWRFAKCGYGERGPRHEDVVNALIKVYNEYSQGTYSDEQAAVTSLSSALDEYAPLIKDDAFEAEAEWRLVSPPISYLPTSGIKFREGVTSLIPYLEFSLQDIDYRLSGATLPTNPSLQLLTVGPGPNPEAAAEAATGLLRVSGLHTSVGSSRIPFREI